ncbi:MAG: hypothetical protein HFE99_10305 [Ruminiclostridium sp.]|jgi:hypothetical protein|nr:hypothetical protein [Ruminiclostridium sp.]
MKKKTAAVLLTGALLSLALCACSNQDSGQGSTPAPGTEGNGESKASTSALATITNKDKDPLALGMTQAEVEAILPMVSGSESEAMGTTYAYFGTEPENQVYVGFMDGVATTLSVGGNFQTQQPLESSNWSLEGVTLGAKRADVEKALGKPTKEEPVPITGADGETTVAEGQVTLQYYYDADDKLMTEDTQNAKKVVGILLNGDKVQSFGTFTLVQSAAAPTQDEAPEAAE